MFPRLGWRPCAESMSAACRSSTCPQGLPRRPTWLPTSEGKGYIRWQQRWALPTGPARQLSVWVRHSSDHSMRACWEGGLQLCPLYVVSLKPSILPGMDVHHTIIIIIAWLTCILP